MDYGCGNGFGTVILSQYAKKVFGTDTDQEVIEKCINTYKIPNLIFKKIEDQYPLSFEDETFDVIVTFHVLEHVYDIKGYLSEIQRILTKNGVLFIATPNKRIRQSRIYKGWNPEHLREYTYENFKDLLEQFFKNVDIRGIFGSKETYKIELSRIREMRNPLIKNLYLPSIYRLKKILPETLNHKITKLEQNWILKSKKHGNSEFYDKFDVNDFIISKTMKNCISFLAICHKV